MIRRTCPNSQHWTRIQLQVLHKFYKYFATKQLIFYIGGFKAPTQKDKIFNILQTEENAESYKGKIEKDKDVGNNMFTPRNKVNHNLTNKINPKENQENTKIITKDACFACDACTQTVTRQKIVCVIM
jgi:hypothetical protein